MYLFKSNIRRPPRKLEAYPAPDYGPRTAEAGLEVHPPETLFASIIPSIYMRFASFSEPLLNSGNNHPEPSFFW